MKKNKWVMENGKWSEYKCIKFNTKDKDYMNVLNKAVKLHHEDIHYIANTLEDILQVFQKRNRTGDQKCC